MKSVYLKKSAYVFGTSCKGLSHFSSTPFIFVYFIVCVLTFSGCEVDTQALLLKVGLENNVGTFVKEPFPAPGILEAPIAHEAYYCKDTEEIVLNLEPPATATHLLVGLTSSQDIYGQNSAVPQEGYYLVDLHPDSTETSFNEGSYTIIISTDNVVRRTKLNIHVGAMDTTDFSEYIDFSFLPPFSVSPKDASRIELQAINNLLAGEWEKNDLYGASKFPQWVSLTPVGYAWGIWEGTYIAQYGLSVEGDAILLTDGNYSLIITYGIEFENSQLILSNWGREDSYQHIDTIPIDHLSTGCDNLG